MDIFVAAGQMLVLFAMMFTGYFLARRDWINDSLSSALSRLVVNIFNPFLMISSVFGQSLKQSGPLFWENLVLVGIFYLLLFLAGFFIVFVLRPTSQTAPIYKLLTLRLTSYWEARIRSDGSLSFSFSSPDWMRAQSSDAIFVDKASLIRNSPFQLIA